MEKFALCAAITAAAVLAATGAFAAQCEGVDARKSAEPVMIHKADDGAMTMLIQSTGSNTIISPAGMTGGAIWQRCTGLWTVNADKSGGGSGHCYSVAGNGDQWIISWEGGDAGGTWAYESGTGKYAGWSGSKGTWKSGTRYGDGMHLTLWEGTCAE